MRIEVGMRDIENGVIMTARRDDVGNKVAMAKTDLITNAIKILTEMQTELFKVAAEFRDSRIQNVTSVDEFNKFFAGENNIDSGFAVAYAIDDKSVEDFIKPLKVTARCMPLADNDVAGICIFTGKPAQHKMVFAKAY